VTGLLHGNLEHLACKTQTLLSLSKQFPNFFMNMALELTCMHGLLQFLLDVSRHQAMGLSDNPQQVDELSTHRVIIQLDNTQRPP